MDLNKEISKDKYKFKFEYDIGGFHVSIYKYKIENVNKNLLKFLVEHGANINKVINKSNVKLFIFKVSESTKK